MLRQFIYGILLLPVLGSASADADTKLLLDCAVEKVLDSGSFENINDFSFEEYGDVYVDMDSAGNVRVHIGAMEYESDSYDEKTIAPIYKNRLLVGYAVRSPEGERLEIVVSGGVARGNAGGFYWQSDKDEPYHRVADLKCRGL